MADFGVTGEVVVTSEKAESAFDRVGDKASQMANEVVTSAGKAGQAVDKIGDGADKGAEKFTRAEARMRDSIKRSTRELEMLGKTASQKFEANLEFKGLDKAKFQPFLNELRQAEEATKRAETGISSMSATAQMAGRAMALAFSGAAITGFLGKVVSVQREFDVLNSSLKTVTGSSAAAEREMAWLKDFAKETPFGLAQATDGFVKMKALGLDPTRASLTSFGNTAAAMGKDLKQMIEAVADASTGEFERLKEFGIKARKEGDSVSLTFQGVTTTVRNSAEQITKYLEDIGNQQFGGAMAERAKTLDGAIAELGDTWDELFRTVNQNATGTLIADTVRMATAAVSDLTEVLGAMTRGADDSARATGALTTIQNGLGTVFETVAVLGLNVKYVLEQIGTELGGLAAQAAAVATLQFSQAAEIGRMMKEDAAAARAQVDAGTARILNARQDALNRGSTLAGSANAGIDKYLAGMTTPPRPTRPASGGGGGGGGRAARPRAQTERESEEARAYAQAMEAIAKAQMTAAIAGENYTTTQQRLVDIMTSPAWRNMPEAWRVLIAQQGEAAIMAEQHAAAQQKMLAARQAELSAVQSDTAALADGNAQLRQQIDMLGMTTAERLDYTRAINEGTIAKLKDKASSLEMFDAESDVARQLREQIAALEDRNALLGHQAEKEQYLAEQTQLVEFWKSIDQTAHDVFVNIFEDGAGTFKRLGQTLKSALLDMLYQLTVKRWIINIGASFGATGGIFGDGQGGAGSLLGTASNLNTAWGMLSGTGGNMGALTGLMSGSMSWANAMGSVYANTTGTGISGLLATNGAYGTAGGAGAGLGATAAGIAAIAAPLIIGALVERNSRDRFSGAAYATSGGNDPFVNTVAGSTGFNYLTGDLPDRAALMARLEELGAPMEAISDWNDRALLRLMESAAADNSEFGINWTSRVRDMRDTPDFYRGAGYAHPEELGWWNNKDNANLSTDPALIQASRDIALAIIGPLEGIGALIGDEAAYRATVGFANRGEGNGLWAGLNLQRDGQNVADWVNTDDFHSVGEAVRAMYSTALGTLDSFDLPGWADKQVTDARTALDALEGENMGQEAAALYAQTTAGIEQMYRSIQTLIDVFPDFAAATQDSLHGLQELMGGMDQLKAAYSSYIGAFWTEDERRELMTAQLTAQLAELGQTMPTTRAEFRGMVEAAMAAGESGNELAAALLGMSGAMSEVLAEVDAAAAAKQRTDDVWQQLQRLFDEQIGNWKQLASEAKSIFTTADSAARALRGNVSDTRAWDAAQGNAFIDAALAAARASGALPDADALKKAIDSARGGLDMGGYDTVAEYERDQLLLAGKLSELGDVAGNQMSFAEQQVKLLEDQREYWKKQLDLLNTTGLTISSIDEGVSYLADYVRAEQAKKDAAAAEAAEQAKRSTIASSRGDWGGGWGGGGWGGGGGQDLTRTINWDTGEYVYPDGSGGTLSPEELEYFRRIRDGEISPTRVIDDLYQVPRHADGGRYAGGLALVGERGPELINFDSPGHVYTAVQTRDMMRGGDNAELIAELRELRARLDKIERNTAVLPQTHDVIDRVTAGGNAMLTEAA